MKKKKAAGYLAVIASLIALSIVTPLVISTVSGYIAGRIRKADTEEAAELPDDQEDPEDAGASDAADEELTQLSVETEDDEEENIPQAEAVAPSKETQKEGTEKSDTIIIEDTYYDEPWYDSQEEEDAANQKTYQDMTEKLQTMAEASETYRRNFNPIYDELKSGLMNSFISGREQQFYDDIGNYCFGHYNTSYQIKKVRFDALLEDTSEQTTVILEFFTERDLSDEDHVPDLKLCTYNKKTQAFVFFAGAGR